MNQASDATTTLGTGSASPGVLGAYDRNPVLSEQETCALATLARDGSVGLDTTEGHLGRLLQPMADVLRASFFGRTPCVVPMMILIHEMQLRGTPYWAWSTSDWVQTIGVTGAAFVRRHCLPGDEQRQAVVLLAYHLGQLTDFSGFAPHGLSVYRTAVHLFGVAEIEAAVQRVATVLLGWGYTGDQRDRELRSTIARLFIAARSPRLDDITRDQLVALQNGAAGKGLAQSLGLVSRVLAVLGIIAAPLPSGTQGRPVTERLRVEGIAPLWVHWCLAWYGRSTLAPKTRYIYLCQILLVGRWLATSHPTVTSPEEWDYDLAADFIAAIDALRIGDWWDHAQILPAKVGTMGKPVTPKTKSRYLAVMRRFFVDLQEVPHRLPGETTARTIAPQFSPGRAFRTPRSLAALIGPDPRIIDEAWWWKLCTATQNLTEEDLPHSSNGSATYPITLVRAVAMTWCFSARRCDEILRLRVGCIRWQWDAAMHAEDGTPVHAGGVCFLHVPVNKTNTAFTVPVHALVGKAIELWESVRPAQPQALDPKTGEMVDLLFSIRAHRIARNYLNETLIPLLCRVAGVPEADRRGTITSHRARATLATLYYNTSDGLTLPELQQFLGHRSAQSTQAYVKPSPTKLAKAVERANKSSRLARVLVDPTAAARGEPAIFYDLGDGTFCGNPAWSSCSHRMACIKCPMHVGADLAHLIRAREGVLHLLQEVPDLTDDERAVAEGDREVLTRLVDRHQDIPPPEAPNARYIFNPSAQMTHGPVPLAMFRAGGDAARGPESG